VCSAQNAVGQNPNTDAVLLPPLLLLLLLLLLLQGHFHQPS
jgi:hypothetical protein